MNKVCFIHEILFCITYIKVKFYIKIVSFELYHEFETYVLCNNYLHKSFLLNTAVDKYANVKLK